MDHTTRETEPQARQEGEKSSEINVVRIVRTLLSETGLDSQKISLDAHHCTPTTTSQIHQAKGIYLVQVKENQAALLRQCQACLGDASCNSRIARAQQSKWPYYITLFAPRLKHSQLSALIVIKRETYQMSTKKSTVETSYYISNQAVIFGTTVQSKDLIQAVQRHWAIESNNWIRDVTFSEDQIKVKSGNQGQIMGLLRGLAIELIRKTDIKNFQAAIERFNDKPSDLELMLRKARFL
ncbi:ISAs1 family transposase [Iodobacter sp.]|uniref:ISAs1 family transposase n=1 Tax=Iodobacter sp. TaxID=1915058 RepID=UPI0025E30BFA|nr:ISAs1 family transposase [Iodobacter sp.]